MEWELKQPARGDMVRIAIGSIFHYGIFVSEEEVIQFGYPPVGGILNQPENVTVVSSDIHFFCGNAFLEVGVPDKKEKKKVRKADDIVAAARARMGEGGYSIIHNNCEHFVYECVFGEKRSSQVDDIRQKVQKMLGKS